MFDVVLSAAFRVLHGAFDRVAADCHFRGGGHLTKIAGKS
jgi:hypothetical protein